MLKRKQHAPEFEAKVALKALKGERTDSELVSGFGVQRTMINQWKRALLDGASGVFERGGRKARVIDEDQVGCADITYCLCVAASCMWLQSWIGAPAGFSRGGSQACWMPTSASRR